MQRDDDSSALGRRDVLRGVGAAALSLGVPACGSSDDGEEESLPKDGLPPYRHSGPLGPETLFQHGVASGDPLPAAVILWTRVTPDAEGSVDVWWEIATDTEFTARVQVGTFTTGPERDYTVKVDVGGLEAGRTYYYRFLSLGRASPIGRTKTAPAGPVGRLRFGVASCASFAHGYFHAYRALAERLDLDAVLHLGDYIYEYGSSEFGDARQYEPPHEIVTLADYRQRHAQYKRDPDLQEVHRQHPFVCVWDDHEIANNAWVDGAGNHQPDVDGSWSERRAAAMQAYAEWIPIREQPDGRIFRKLGYGDLVDLILLDTRHWGRNAPDRPILAPPPAPDPERTLLGDDQAAWLEEQLSTSSARWKLIGQQVMIGNLIVSPGQTLANLDQWQGFPESRERLLSFLADHGDNVVVLTGDIHSSWANELVIDPNDPAQYDPATGEGAVAVEFVTPGITSAGLEGVSELIEALRPANPHVRFIDSYRRGFMVVDVTEARVQAAWFLYDAVEQPERPEERFTAAWSVQSGEHRLHEDTEPAPAADAAPPAP